MRIRAVFVAVSFVTLITVPAQAEERSMDQLKEAALKFKLKAAESQSSTQSESVSRSGALIYNVTINLKTGAPAGPYFCKAYAFHYGSCALEGEEYCYKYYEYELAREVQATGSGSQRTCSVRLNYNFPNGDPFSDVYPWIDVYHRNTNTGIPSASGYSGQLIKPVLLPSKATTTFNVVIDQ